VNATGGAALLYAVFSLLAAGCLSVPLGNSGGADPHAQQELNNAVPLYDSAHSPSNHFIRVGMITASGCDNRFLGGPGRDQVIADLRQQAETMGANGITDLACEATEDRPKGCIWATACSATALKIVSPDDKGN
jgi:hypothetical protein